MMDENRLYQYAYPKLPCSFVGKWHVSEGTNEYWMTINQDTTFSLEAIQYGAKHTLQPLRTGIWSSTSPNVAIQFFDDGFFWPINQGAVDWVTPNQFTLRNGFEQNFYYHRHSEPNPSCVL